MNHREQVHGATCTQRYRNLQDKRRRDALADTQGKAVETNALRPFLRRQSSVASISREGSALQSWARDWRGVWHDAVTSICVQQVMHHACLGYSTCVCTTCLTRGTCVQRHLALVSPP